MAQRTILCTAPSKTFNLAGIQASNIIIPNEELRRRYRSVAERHHALSPNAFAEAAVVGAYRDSEAWLDKLLVYLKGNVDYFCAEVGRSLPKLRVLPPEGTYLAWVDCSGLGLSPEERQRFLVEKCKVAFNDGRKIALYSSPASQAEPRIKPSRYSSITSRGSIGRLCR